MNRETKYWASIVGAAVILIAGAVIYRAYHPVRTPAAERQERIQAQIQALVDKHAAETGSGSSASSSGSSLSSSSSASGATVSSEHSSADEIGDADVEVRTVLVDQAFTAAANAHGRDWLTAIKAKKLSGTSKFARLEVSISRNGENRSFQSVAVYFANAKGNSALNEWTRGRYLDAHLLKACGRAIAPTGSFSTLGVEKADKVFDMSAVPTTAEDPCNLATETHDFLAELEKGPIVLGFYPTNFNSKVTVTLVHDGGITVSPF